jgi:hypothetical protein
MLLTPDGFAGNYFNSYQRFATQQEILESYKLTENEWAGRHDFLIGATGSIAPITEHFRFGAGG